MQARFVLDSLQMHQQARNLTQQELGEGECEEANLFAWFLCFCVYLQLLFVMFVVIAFPSQLLTPNPVVVPAALSRSHIPPIPKVRSIMKTIELNLVPL